MNIFKKLFGTNSEKTEIISGINEVRITAASGSNPLVPPGSEIIYKSDIPEYTSIGNLIFEKKYQKAIELGEKLLQENPTSAGVHINLMVAYFKVRKESPYSYDKSVEHAKLAMLYGHNTGYAQERLVINLEKSGKINQAIQVCDIVLMDEFNLSIHACRSKEDFIKRKEKLIKKLAKTTDNESGVLFTDEEISFLIKEIQNDEERQRQENIKHEEKMKKWEEDLNF